jgi:hypothetical protein
MTEVIIILVAVFGGILALILWPALYRDGI